MRLLWLLTLPIALMVAHHDDTESAAKSASCELIATKHLVVNAKINGKGPFRLIFDTGSPVVLLNTKVAREAEIHKIARELPKNKSALAGQVYAKSIEVGGAVADMVPVTIFDHPTLTAVAEMVGPIDGIIGYPYFGRFRTTIDYPALKLSFQPNGHMPEDAIQTMMKAMVDRGKKRQARPLAPMIQLGLEVEKPDGKPGVRVRSVLPGSAASKSGIQPGDRLLTIDDRWTDSREDCVAILTALPEGKPVSAVVDRSGGQRTMQFTANAGF